MTCAVCGRTNLSQRELEVHTKYYHKPKAQPDTDKTPVGVCPDCGSTLIRSEGCVKCHACGYSHC